MQPSPSLAELQRWLRWALTHPLGVHRAAAGEHLLGLPARFIEPDARALSFIAGDVRGRDAGERLSVHGTGYFARLHGTLRLEYPRLAGALGEDEFRVLVAAHLLRAPSRSASLADLGEDLVGTLRLHPAGKERPWLVDLAALERALAEVWLSGPSGKAGRVLEDDEDPGSIALALSSEVRLVAVSWDVADWRPDRGLPSRRSGRLAVWRAGAGTGVEWLEDAPGAVLASMSPWAHLTEVCELAGTLGMSSEQVTRAFGHWAERGWIVRPAL
jgi:hypothetical protein